MEPIYVVSGLMRSGTSMMMHASEVGGMHPFTSTSRDEFRLKHADDDYDPNENGLYEIDMMDVEKMLAAPADYAGRLVKFLCRDGVLRTFNHPRRVVFMRRNAEEARQSCEALFLTDRVPPDMEKYDETVDTAIRECDCPHIVVWYRDVIDNAVREFTKLRDWGWPIDPEAAAAVVDPELYRFRLELLEVGI